MLIGMTSAIICKHIPLSVSMPCFCFSQMEFVGKTGDSGGGMYVVSILNCTVTKLN